MRSAKLKIPVYRPTLGHEEMQAVVTCVRSSWISSKGPYIEKFESKLARITRRRYAVSVCNGTVALHAALLSLGIGQGDEVIVPTLTYIAPVNAIRYCGAKPVFVDADELTWQMNPVAVEEAVGRKTRAILAVHLYGHPCNLDALQRVARRRGLDLIEDCAEALGTTYRGKPVGHISSVATYSFFGNKTVTTGEGGMVTTDQAKLADNLRRIRGQGLAPKREYWHDRVGYNYRMTNLCAAIGLAQLKKLKGFLRRKKSLADFYSDSFSDLPLNFQALESHSESSYWMVSILAENGRHRDSLRAWLHQAGVETRPLFQPIHLMPMYRTPRARGRFPMAESLATRGLNLPSHPSLSFEERHWIADRVRAYFKTRRTHP